MICSVNFVWCNFSKPLSSSLRRGVGYDNAPDVPHDVPHTCYSVRTISTLTNHLSATCLFPIGCSSACLFLYVRSAACAANLERVTSRVLTRETGSSHLIILRLVTAESRTLKVHCKDSGIYSWRSLTPSYAVLLLKEESLQRKVNLPGFQNGKFRYPVIHRRKYRVDRQRCVRPSWTFGKSARP